MTLLAYSKNEVLKVYNIRSLHNKVRYIKESINLKLNINFVRKYLSYA